MICDYNNTHWVRGLINDCNNTHWVVLFFWGKKTGLDSKCVHVIVKLICRTYVSKTSSVLHLSAVFIVFRGKHVEQGVEYCALYMG